MILQKSFRFVCLVILCTFLGGSSFCSAQKPRLAPTKSNVPYDQADPAQKLDVYLTESDKPTPAIVFIHGGGWRAGSKKGVPAWLLSSVEDGWLSVVSIEYRFTSVASHPAQVNDCLRAIQFVRRHAEEWKIDARRIGVSGGSAGAHLSLWVALHDDVADPKATDPVKRQSSRVACAVSFAGPTDWSLLGVIKHGHPAYRQLLGYEPGTPADEMDAKAKEDVSPITFVSSDDPPILLLHGDKDSTVPIEHSRRLLEQLKGKHVQSELIVVKGANHSVAGAGPHVTQRAAEFVKEHLK